MLEEFYKDIENIINNKEKSCSEIIQNTTKKDPNFIHTMPVIKDNFLPQIKISQDYTFLIIERKNYKIPNWYNKNMIKNKDKKTIQMILIHYGIDYTKYFIN